MPLEKARVTLVSSVPEPAPPLRQIFSDDTLWERLRAEANDVLSREPILAPLILTAVVNRHSFEEAVIHRIASRLANTTVAADLIADSFLAALRADPGIGKAFRADIAAVVDRDPACTRLIEPLLYFKGFQAIQTHRLAHFLWNDNQQDLALYLQSRSSDLFQTDIHPAARFGRGIFLDHATGLVVGATSVVEDDVSILQNVTLGGTGKESGDRHPKVRHGVMIGAGAKISRQYRSWPLLARRGGLGRAEPGATEFDCRRSSGQSRGQRRLSGTRPRHEPDLEPARLRFLQLLDLRRRYGTISNVLLSKL